MTGHDNTLRNSLHAGDTASPGEVSWSFPRSFHTISAPQASPWPQKEPLPLISFALLRTGHDNTLRNSLAPCRRHPKPRRGLLVLSSLVSFYFSTTSLALATEGAPLPLIRHTLLRTSLHNTLHNSHETAAPTAWTQPKLPRTFITKL